MKGVGCIPLLSTYDEPEQLNVNADALFSNVVLSWDGEMITLACASTTSNKNPEMKLY